MDIHFVLSFLDSTFSCHFLYTVTESSSCQNTRAVCLWFACICAWNDFGFHFWFCMTFCFANWLFHILLSLVQLKCILFVEKRPRFVMCEFWIVVLFLQFNQNNSIVDVVADDYGNLNYGWQLEMSTSLHIM